ncbi:TonB-dependent receptor [Persephonella sp.]|uniref:TonB-dependent receptor plug domain-containing protein n=1 Tax=Persephonella sp. TaxID=2060922 RepID=UPI0026181092|nr:TonB-dependent receptor [Persephonella sp.]
MKKVLISALLSFPAFAYQLENIKVESGYGTESGISQITSPVDVITEEEINEKHPFDFKNTIFNKNGFAFSSNGGFGQITSIYLWGTNPKRTVLYIDGIRANDFTTPNQSAAYELLMMDDIQRVEIVKGVQSGVWGTDAVGGVINIVTQKPEKGFHLKTSGLIGDYNTKKAGITLSYANEKIDMILGYHWFRTSGFSAAEPFNKRWDEAGYERDPYRNETINFKMGWNITPKDRVEAVVKNIDAVIHYDAAAAVDAKNYDDPFGLGYPSEYFNHYSQKFYKLQYDKKLKNNHLTFLFAKSKFNRTQYGGYEGEYREYTAKNKFNYSFGFVKFGFSRQDFIQSKDGYSAPKLSRYHNNGIYLTNLSKINRFYLSQSIRHDSYSAFKDKTTWKLGAKYLFDKDLYISANWGTGYNVPTIDQLFNPYWGNENLKPENSIQWDIGAGYKGFSISYFKYSIRDMIDYDFATSKYQNIPGKTKIKGIDASYSRYINLLNTFLRLNYTYLDSKDPKTGKRLAGRPLHQLGFDVIWYPAEAINIGFSGLYVDKRKDSGNRETGYYTVINAFANFNINKYLLAYVKLDNITDKFYQTVAGYATPDRSLYAGMQLKW